jgi:hypothetical protein
MRLQFRGQLACMLTDELVNGLLGLDFDCGCVHGGTYQTRLDCGYATKDRAYVDRFGSLGKKLRVKRR